MNPEEIRLLYDYNSWANRRCMEACSSLAPEQFTRDLSSSFRSVRDTLAHIMNAEWIWLERFQGRSPSAIPKDEYPDLLSLRARWTEIENNLMGFVGGLTQANLDHVMEYKTINFGVYTNPMWQSLQHLVNHGTYHRGQITTLLRQLGGKPLLTDLMHFYRERSTAVGA
ncbi:MAG TPA: DinB family protein [Candidatus Dormibacteraeota bacterium]|nr:DinB family protein [Candidatus Dormibacteraeota bacterium]